MFKNIARARENAIVEVMMLELANHADAGVAQGGGATRLFHHIEVRAQAIHCSDLAYVNQNPIFAQLRPNERHAHGDLMIQSPS